MFEHRSQPLATVPAFVKRITLCLVVALLVLSSALLLGMAGYHWIAGLGWVDAFLNAAMILTGMGPVNPLATRAAKLFAGGYAIFSGLIFLTVMGIVLAPVLHRLMHKFHLADEDVNQLP
jgi:hypothetical protein